jgi:hypothetical protein
LALITFECAERMVPHGEEQATAKDEQRQIRRFWLRQNDGQNEQKQIPPLRYGMTNK